MPFLVLRLHLHSLAHQVDISHLVLQFCCLESGPIWVQFADVDFVSAGSVLTGASEDEELLLLLVIGNGRRPARLGAPATLRDSAPDTFLQVEEHDVIEARACDLVVDVLTHTRRVRASRETDAAQAVAEGAVVFTPVD